MYRMTDEEFEAAVEDALASIPRRFLKALDNIQLAVQDEPTAEQLACVEDDGHWDEEEDGGGEGELDGEDAYGNKDEGEGDLLGLYEGIALTERDEYGFCEIPDVITVFKGPHERACDTRDQVVEEIGKTVIHEIGHYFGLDDAKLYSMGY